LLTLRHSRSVKYLIHCATAALLVGFSPSTFPLAGAETSEGSVPMSVLKKCAGIDEQLKRLACYDQVVERPAGATARTASSASAAPIATEPGSPQKAFGLYSVEHPAPSAPAESVLTAKVISLGSNSRGHSTVTLEGDQVWELDSADPVLAAGETVTVKRGALGAFILTTAGGRLHRVHRIR
jgi:hypothetical protein